MEETLYIGTKKIKSVENIENKVNVTLEDDTQIEFAEELYNLVVTKAEQPGELKDIVNDKIARFILQKLADFGVSRQGFQSVVISLDALMYNLYDFSVAKKYGYTETGEILVKDILSS